MIIRIVICVKKMFEAKMLMLFTWIVLGVPLLVFVLWFEIKFQITPLILICSAIGGTIIPVLLIWFLAQHLKENKMYIFINILTILLIAILIYTLPTTVFTKYSKEVITEYFDLIDIRGGSYGVPASYIFPLDDDESVDINYVREYYGSNYIRLISGTVMKEGVLKGKKVLIVFERGAFNPLKSMTVFELDKSFNTEINERNQGYEQWTYPIDNILLSPE